MASINIKSIKKYLIEALLIVFSVLFALAINQWMNNHQTAVKTKVALDSIQQELYRNQAILQRWQKQHTILRDQLAKLSSGEDTKRLETLRESPYFDLAKLSDGPLIDAILTDTAWETAKSSGLVSEFEFETAERITVVYDMQQILTDRTVIKISDLYFAAASQDASQLDQTLIQFHLLFVELVGQEYVLAAMYEDALNQFLK